MIERLKARLKDPTTVMILILVAVPILFNAVILFPEISQPVPNLNDDAAHFMLVQRASAALAGGENPFDHWVPELELGFPVFLYYQHLPHLTVVFLHYLLLKQVSLLTLFNAVRYILLVGFPITVFWSMRRMEFPIIASAIAAAFASLLSSDGRYGFEYDSYVFRGWGMYTQLWAMHLFFISLACIQRLLAKGTGYVSTALACSALVVSHVVYAYMMAVSAVVLFLLNLRPAPFQPGRGELVDASGAAGTGPAAMQK